MANKSSEERMARVTIRSGRESETIEAWRYYSIVNILRQFGANRKEANEAANWARKAEPGESREVWPNIAMEVASDGTA